MLRHSQRLGGWAATDPRRAPKLIAGDDFASLVGL
jgi:hypothetical protein